VTRPVIVREYVDAHVDALVTDVHLGTGDQLPDVLFALPAERAPQFSGLLWRLVSSSEHRSVSAQHLDN
jgi:hypothetical protein